jgi:dipeptidyl aminopeptidase/acylaminoacyl peptidase
MRGLRTAGIVITVGLVVVGVFSQPPVRFWVQNPISGARLAVQVILPQTYDGTPLPTLVLVPGGAGDSSGFTKAPPGGVSKAQRMVDNGSAIVVFDPDGRGRSEGVDDDNGYLQQDRLAAVIEYAATLPGVDESRIGLVSYSYGVTMAADALARYPNLPDLFFIDREGPANRNDTGGCDEDRTGHLQGHPCDDEGYWRQREASRFALHQLQIPYQRLQ